MQKILSLLKEFEDLFGVSLGKRDTAPVKLKLNPGSKSFNARHYPVPQINKETFCKDIQNLVEIGVLTSIHKLQYGMPIFIISNKEGTVRFITDDLKLNHIIVRKPYP